MAAAAPASATAAQIRPAAVLEAQLVTTTSGASVAVAPTRHPLLVRDPAQYARAKAAANRTYGSWAAARQLGSGVFSPLLSIIGLNKPGLSAAGAGGSTPPDTTGAIGPAWYVEIVNSELAVYSRATLASPPIASASEDTFTGSSTTCDGQMKWDQVAQRFEYYSLDCGAAAGSQGISFGWSKTASPTPLTGASANWCRFHLVTGSNLEDYGKLGNSNTSMIIGANEFNGSGSYVDSPIFTVPKPASGSTTCPTSLTVHKFVPAAANEFTPEPANIFGSSANGYVIAINPNNTALRMYTVGGTAVAPTLTDNGNITVPAFAVPAAVPQPGTSNVIDSADTRLTQANAALDSQAGGVTVWTQHTVAGTGGGPSVVRWYEVKAGSSTPIQTGTVSVAGAFAFNGAITPTTAGNAGAINYNVGSATQLVQIRARIHAAGTAAGTMSNDTVLATSSGSDQDFSCSGGRGSCRWGDYAGASFDPTCGGSVWGTSQINGSPDGFGDAQWQTQNFRLVLDECPVASFTVTPASPTHGTPATFNGSASSDSDGSIVSYIWRFGDGTTSTTATSSTAHTYAAPGTYQAVLFVKDSSGLTASTLRVVTVS